MPWDITGLSNALGAYYQGKADLNLKRIAMAEQRRQEEAEAQQRMAEIEAQMAGREQLAQFQAGEAAKERAQTFLGDIDTPEQAMARASAWPIVGPQHSQALGVPYNPNMLYEMAAKQVTERGYPVGEGRRPSRGRTGETKPPMLTAEAIETLQRTTDPTLKAMLMAQYGVPSTEGPLPTSPRMGPPLIAPTPTEQRLSEETRYQRERTVQQDVKAATAEIERKQKEQEAGKKAEVEAILKAPDELQGQYLAEAQKQYPDEALWIAVRRQTSKEAQRKRDDLIISLFEDRAKVIGQMEGKDAKTQQAYRDGARSAMFAKLKREFTEISNENVEGILNGILQKTGPPMGKAPAPRDELSRRIAQAQLDLTLAQTSYLGRTQRRADIAAWNTALGKGATIAGQTGKPVPVSPEGMLGIPGFGGVPGPVPSFPSGPRAPRLPGFPVKPGEGGIITPKKKPEKPRATYTRDDISNARGEVRKLSDLTPGLTETGKENVEDRKKMDTGLRDNIYRLVGARKQFGLDQTLDWYAWRGEKVAEGGEGAAAWRAGKRERPDYGGKPTPVTEEGHPWYIIKTDTGGRYDQRTAYMVIAMMEHGYKDSAIRKILVGSRIPEPDKYIVMARRIRAKRRAK